MLGHPSLPESLIKHSMSVLAQLSSDERDLVRIVVEVINELRDPDMESFPSTETLASVSGIVAYLNAADCMYRNSRQLMLIQL